MLTIRLFLIFQFITFGITAQQTVKFVNCWDEDEMILHGVTWYRNDSLVEESDFGFSNVKEIVLAHGTYVAEFLTFYKDTLRETVHIVNDTQTICFDALVLSKEKLPKQYWTDRISKGDTVNMLCTTTACRMPEFTDQLLLYKKGNELYVRYDKQEKVLEKEMIKWINTFEAQLRNIPKYTCTTKSHYQVTFRDEALDILDGSCKWNGFDNLLIKLGFEE